jgi:dTDP-4-dehydrorhamnose reductase
MKIAVTGAAGLLGRDLVQGFSSDHEVVALTRQDGDITDANRMRELLTAIKPDIVVHAAAIADVDACELHPVEAFRVNAEATRSFTEIVRDLGAGMAHISTDAVFDGTSERPYVETDPVNPISVYGRTKVAAEDYVRTYSKHWIFRVSLLFGPGKANFVNKGMSKPMGKEPYAVASDQLGNATYTLDATATMLQVLESGVHGTFHLCNQGSCTRLELAQKALELAALDPAYVIGKPISEMHRPGPRTKYSVMEMRALREAEIPLPRRWEDALAAYVATVQAVK